MLSSEQIILNFKKNKYAEKLCEQIENRVVVFYNDMMDNRKDVNLLYKYVE